MTPGLGKIETAGNVDMILGRNADQPSPERLRLEASAILASVPFNHGNEAAFNVKRLQYALVELPYTANISLDFDDAQRRTIFLEDDLTFDASTSIGGGKEQRLTILDDGAGRQITLFNSWSLQSESGGFTNPITLNANEIITLILNPWGATDGTIVVNKFSGT
jgi:hypothetical protein